MAGTRETCLVVGIDGSPQATDALRWASHVAGALGTQLMAIMAWHPADHGAGAGPEMRAELQASVERRLDRLVAAAGIPAAETRAIEGEPPVVLRNAAAECDARMLVVGTRGLGTIQGLLLGSVSRSLLFTATCPVVVVPSMVAPVDGWDTVVVGVDGSPMSGDVVAWAAPVAARIGARVVVGRCIDAGAELSAERLEEITSHTAGDVDEAFCAPLRDVGLDYEVVALNAEPREGLVDLATRQTAGLLVVGMHGAGAFHGLGGTTSYLARHSPVPLAVVPPDPRRLLDASVAT